MEVIAERTLLYSPKGEDQRTKLTIQIGKPYWIDEGKTAACPISWDSIYEELADAQGADLLQALQLASDIDPWLQDLRNRFDFYFPDGEPYFE